jgi:DNA-binding NarL/FixJ family response regulator
MKAMDGLEATRQIINHFPGVKVCILTQYDDPSLREAAHEAGACGYLLKDDLSHVQNFVGATIAG